MRLNKAGLFGVELLSAVWVKVFATVLLGLTFDPLLSAVAVCVVLAACALIVAGREIAEPSAISRSSAGPDSQSVRLPAHTRGCPICEADGRYPRATWR